MSVIIRLQNLPWSANAGDIREFFTGLNIPEGGVHIVGGEQGDAFIAFGSDEDARLAMRKTGGILKGIQITLFLSSRNEMQQVIETARQQALAQHHGGGAAPSTAPAVETPAAQPRAAAPTLQPPPMPPTAVGTAGFGFAGAPSVGGNAAAGQFYSMYQTGQYGKEQTQGAVGGQVPSWGAPQTPQKSLQLDSAVPSAALPATPTTPFTGTAGAGGYQWYRQQRQTAGAPASIAAIPGVVGGTHQAVSAGTNTSAPSVAPTPPRNVDPRTAARAYQQQQEQNNAANAKPVSSNFDPRRQPPANPPGNVPGSGNQYGTGVSGYGQPSHGYAQVTGGYSQATAGSYSQSTTSGYGGYTATSSDKAPGYGSTSQQLNATTAQHQYASEAPQSTTRDFYGKQPGTDAKVPAGIMKTASSSSLKTAPTKPSVTSSVDQVKKTESSDRKDSKSGRDRDRSRDKSRDIKDSDRDRDRDSRRRRSRSRSTSRSREYDRRRRHRSRSRSRDRSSRRRRSRSKDRSRDKSRSSNGLRDRSERRSNDSSSSVPASTTSTLSTATAKITPPVAAASNIFAFAERNVKDSGATLPGLGEIPQELPKELPTTILGAPATQTTITSDMYKQVKTAASGASPMEQIWPTMMQTDTDQKNKSVFNDGRENRPPPPHWGGTSHSKPQYDSQPVSRGAAAERNRFDENNPSKLSWNQKDNFVPPPDISAQRSTSTEPRSFGRGAMDMQSQRTMDGPGRVPNDIRRPMDFPPHRSDDSNGRKQDYFGNSHENQGGPPQGRRFGRSDIDMASSSELRENDFNKGGALREPPNRPPNWQPHPDEMRNRGPAPGFGKRPIENPNVESRELPRGRIHERQPEDERSWGPINDGLSDPRQPRRGGEVNRFEPNSTVGESSFGGAERRTLLQTPPVVPGPERPFDGPERPFDGPEGPNRRRGDGRFDGPDRFNGRRNRFEDPDGRNSGRYGENSENTTDHDRPDIDFDGPVHEGKFERGPRNFDGPEIRQNRPFNEFETHGGEFDEFNGPDQRPGRFGGNRGGRPGYERFNRGGGMRGGNWQENFPPHNETRFGGEFRSSPVPGEGRGCRGGFRGGRGAGRGRGMPDRPVADPKIQTCSVEILNLPPPATYKNILAFFTELYIGKNAIKILGDEHGNKIGVALVRFTNPEDALTAVSKDGRFMFDAKVQVNLIEEEVYDKYEDIISRRIALRMNQYERPQTFPKLMPTPWVKVSGLPPGSEENDAFQIFEGYDVKDIVREFYPKTSNPTGCFFTRFSCPEEAADVAMNLDGYNIEDYAVGLCQVMPEVVRIGAPIELQKPQPSHKNSASMQNKKNPKAEDLSDEEEFHYDDASESKVQNKSTNKSERGDRYGNIEASNANKRPIDEVYDVDDPGKCGSSKRQSSFQELLTDSVVISNITGEITDADVRDFFSDVGFIPEKIHFLPPDDNTNQSKVYVVFPFITQAEQAIQKSGQFLGSSSVVIDLVAKPEVTAAMGEPFNPLELIRKRDKPLATSGESVNDTSQGSETTDSNSVDTNDSSHRSGGGPPVRLIRQSLRSNTTIDPPSMSNNASTAKGEVIPEMFGNPGCVVALGNVPLQAKTEDIVNFLIEDFPDIGPEHVIRRFDEHDSPTADARVAFETPQDARRAIKVLNNRVMIDRPISMAMV